MSSIISVANLSKTYGSGFKALDNINLEIKRAEIFALLGPNGAGKTTLISIICGIADPTAGSVAVDGHDIIKSYRAARSLIGLVPQEPHTDAFESVWATVSFSRRLFGKPRNPAHIEKSAVARTAGPVPRGGEENADTPNCAPLSPCLRPAAH
jgi:ABC-2 type transport system ATP-binding protein